MRGCRWCNGLCEGECDAESPEELAPPTRYSKGSSTADDLARLREVARRVCDTYERYDGPAWAAIEQLGEVLSQTGRQDAGVAYVNGRDVDKRRATGAATPPATG